MPGLSWPEAYYVTQLLGWDVHIVTMSPGDCGTMTMTTGQIAAAIVDRDVAMLQSLPEIGKRTAETIIAALHDKVDAFAGASAFAPAGNDAE